MWLGSVTPIFSPDACGVYCPDARTACAPLNLRNAQQVGGARDAERHAGGNHDGIARPSEFFAQRGLAGVVHHLGDVSYVRSEHRMHPPHQCEPPCRADVRREAHNGRGRTLARGTQARIMRVLMGGTCSPGSSTPRSPRATITPSESATIASSDSTAAGFSSFAMIAARPLMSERASSRSCGRCTNESASQSTPSSSPNARSLRSFSVMMEIG